MRNQITGLPQFSLVHDSQFDIRKHKKCYMFFFNSACSLGIWLECHISKLYLLLYLKVKANVFQIKIQIKINSFQPRAYFLSRQYVLIFLLRANQCVIIIIQYDNMWGFVMKAVPKLDESESGQMVLK